MKISINIEIKEADGILERLIDLADRLGGSVAIEPPRPLESIPPARAWIDPAGWPRRRRNR